MELDWGEADPNYFFGRLHGWVVAVNGDDVVVSFVAREGLHVQTWSGEDDRGVGDVRLVEWGDVKTLFIH